MSDIKITHLVLSGGGMRGIMFVGALRYLYLENLHKNITHIAGTSIGSIIGLAIALRLTIEEIEECINKGKYDKKLCNISFKKCINIITEFGLSDIDILTDHLKYIVKQKYPDIENDITFSYLSKRFGINYYVSTTNIYTCKNKIFNIETTPDICVFKACAASMSIPLLFKPVKINDDYYYDGGLTNNFPIKVFENVPMHNVLGMILYRAYHEKDIENSYYEKPKLNFMFIIKQIMKLYEKSRTKVVLSELIEENKIDYYYIPDNVPDIPIINIELINKSLIIKLHDDVFINLLYAGFESMIKYIEKRRILILSEQAIVQKFIDNER
tara:strand:- start:23138 stop:24118 length:981 start_codon:yes stop_codon:yes gene_type:complete